MRTGRTGHPGPVDRGLRGAVANVNIAFLPAEENAAETAECANFKDVNFRGLLRLIGGQGPGHHAEEDLAMGFCLFNNVAIVARYLQKKHGLDKVLVLDWDVHHGNGTQHSFEEDPSVFYVSLHQYPFYPGTGAGTENGRGKGKDATLNCPMPAGALDQDYEKVFCETILPKIDKFKPNTILISAGFDAHQDDPLADVCLTTPFYGWMTERMMEIADKYSGGRIISLLEGGYNLEALPRCVATHLAVLSGNNPHPNPLPEGEGKKE